MSRTYRKLRQSMSANSRRWYQTRGYLKDGVMRDGVMQYNSHSCSHHGGCPYCEANRTFSAQRQAPIADSIF